MFLWILALAMWFWLLGKRLTGCIKTKHPSFKIQGLLWQMEMVLLMFYGWKGNQDPEKNLRNGEVWTGDSGSVPRLKWWRQGLCLVQCSSGWIVIMEPKSWALLWPVLGFPCGTGGKEPACQCRRHKRCGFYPWVRKIPWKRAWQPTSVFLPGECHG